MATSNTALKVADLDFFSIKNNLKDFLRNQDTFTDYDFEGSGMSVLLDVLAYNTYYNAYYMNMAANEAFMDTAQIRSNMLSHGKLINYVPHSSRGALSKINIIATPSDTENQIVNFITLDKYTKLLGKDINGVNYPFVTINANTSAKVNSAFAFANVYIKQGEVITLQYEANTANPKRRFDIPSANVDVSTLTVSVQESASNSYTEEYKQALDLTELKANSNVFFVEENENLNYTIYFGDDVLGKKPKNGSIVIMTYLDNAGSIANNITEFKFSDPIGGLFRDNVIVNVLTGSYGGVDKETIEQMRFRAPYFYTTQNRAVTENDYEALLARDYNNIESISVWGGEDNDPVVYGKVYMSLKTKGYYALTELEKEEIKETLIQNRNVLTIIPEIVDPDYNYLIINGKVTYNPSLTSKTSNQILSDIRNAILQYNERELNTFKSTFRKSKLQYYIENAEPSITGSDIKVYMQKQVLMDTNQTRTYVIRFNAPLNKGSITDKLYSFPQIRVKDRTKTDRDVFIEEIPQSFTGVDSIVVLNPGINYEATPNVSITGDGSGAKAEAVVVNRRIKRIDVTNKGINYTRATVAITGGGGSEATAYPKIENNYGKLRTFYYKANGEKVIVDPEAGEIDYNLGKITLKNLSTSLILANAFYPSDILTLNAISKDEIIMPKRNRILTIDFNDAKSIQLEMVPET